MYKSAFLPWVPATCIALAAGLASAGGAGGPTAGVTVPRIEVLRVSPTGAPVGVRDRACDVTSTLSDASFEGGNFTAQAGFSQGEALAATYTLTAADFPIEIATTEALFVTVGAGVSTTTVWSVEFWQGEPGTGNLVDSYTSDDVDLPHLTMPSGTNGTIILFGIDPEATEQIQINDDGTHKFSVAWRIVQHNQPPANPCFSSPATCCNAFPATDNSQDEDYTELQFPAANWIDALDCGVLGCAAGWTKFSQLPADICRPHGDWVARTTWSSVACQPGVGACCLPDGSCTVTSTTDCQTQEGTYQGDGVDCASANCPLPTGACCFTSNGFCIADTLQTQCENGNGTWLGPDSVCGANNTCPTGACCMPNGACTPGLTQAGCQAQGGTFKGVGTTCNGANCPLPQGACCVNGGAACFLLTQAQCDGVPDGVWSGPFTTCTDGDGDELADECQPHCGDIDFNNDGVFPDTADLTDYLLVQSGGPCPTPACDTIDYNHDGVFPDTTDIFTYLRVFSGGPC